MKKLIVLAGLALSLTGCASGYQQFYQQEAAATPENLQTVQLLKQGETPSVAHVDDLKAAFNAALAKNYKLIGKSVFNGSLERDDGAIEQAKKIGATYVLIGSKFTETRQITTPIYMPTSSTTYNSGYVGGTTYSGTSTTYGSTVVPFTSHQQRYDQAALFFAKSKNAPRFGIIADDLSQDERTRYGQNTGAMVRIVMDDTPAFYANVIVGDLLTEINGAPVMNGRNAGELLSQAPSGQPARLQVIRHGEPKAITVTPR